MSLTSLPSRVYGQQVFLDKFGCLSQRNVVKHLFHVMAAFCLPKPYKYFLYICQIFLGGRIDAHEQIFLVQKLAWLALEHDSLARKNCQFSPYTQFCYTKVTLCYLSRNFSRNFVATQVAREIARRIMPRNQQVSQYFCCNNHCTSRIGFYFLQRLRQRCNAFLKHCTV
jgi:hypothetical protein